MIERNSFAASSKCNRPLKGLGKEDIMQDKLKDKYLPEILAAKDKILRQLFPWKLSQRFQTL